MSLRDNNDSNEENNQQETSDDDAPPAKRQRTVRLLDWRLEPSKSFSDWRILITDEDDEDAAPLGEYNVHKNILAFGDRASDYFATMFETDMVEHQEQCSKISLSKTGAKAFPHLLDFLYQKEIKVDVPELYIHLYPLKEYFQVAGMDDVISQGIFDACKDHDTLVLLDKTARDLGIDTTNDTIFTPMKTSFVQNVLADWECFKKLRRKQLVELIRLEFLLESVKLLDQQDLPEKDRFYVFLLQYIDFSARRINATNSTQFPLQRNQLEEAFGRETSGIWLIENISPGHAACLSLLVLYLEGTYCEPQPLLSESQKAAIGQFHRLTSMDGMSPKELLSRCSRAVSHKSTVRLLSKIRGDIVAHLMFPDITSPVLDPGRR